MKNFKEFIKKNIFLVVGMLLGIAPLFFLGAPLYNVSYQDNLVNDYSSSMLNGICNTSLVGMLFVNSVSFSLVGLLFLFDSFLKKKEVSSFHFLILSLVHPFTILLSIADWSSLFEKSSLSTATIGWGAIVMVVLFSASFLVVAYQYVRSALGILKKEKEETK